MMIAEVLSGMVAEDFPERADPDALSEMLEQKLSSRTRSISKHNMQCVGGDNCMKPMTTSIEPIESY